MARKPTKAATGRTRNVLLAFGAFVIGSAGLAAAALFGANRSRRRARAADAAPDAGHAAPDLAPDGDPGAGGRAPDAFRPDPTAPVPPEMRDSLRPATGPGPTLSGGDSIVSTFGRD